MVVLANMPSFRFFVPWFRCLYPRSSFWYRRSVLCTLVPVLGVQGTSAKTRLLEATLVRTPETHLETHLDIIILSFVACGGC